MAQGEHFFAYSTLRKLIRLDPQDYGDAAPPFIALLAPRFRPRPISVQF